MTDEKIAVSNGTATADGAGAAVTPARRFTQRTFWARDATMNLTTAMAGQWRLTRASDLEVECEFVAAPATDHEEATALLREAVRLLSASDEERAALRRRIAAALGILE